MTSGEAIQTISCPRCKSNFKIRAGVKGTIRCRNCKAAFQIGATSEDRRRDRMSDKTDHRLAIRGAIITGLLALLVGLIIVMMNNSAPKTQKKPDIERQTNYKTPIAVPTRIPKTDIPIQIGTNFIKAMANEDREALERTLAFDIYFRKYDESRPPEERYDQVTPEIQAERRKEAVETLLEPELVVNMQKYLLPAMEAGDGRHGSDLRNDVCTMTFRCPDEKGKDLVLIGISVTLRAGVDRENDWNRPESWGVNFVTTKWVQTTLKIKKPDRGPVDAIMGRKKKAEAEARRATRGGPVEADPERQSPVEGTGATQETAIRDALKVLSDPNETTGAFEAEDKLTEMGKQAIPFLLNELIGKDHDKNDADIYAAFQFIKVLKRITGESFGYGPTTNEGLGGGMTTASGEERVKAVRRWFGWWKLNRTRFTGKKALEPEPEEPGDPRGRGRR